MKFRMNVMKSIGRSRRSILRITRFVKASLNPPVALADVAGDWSKVRDVFGFRSGAFCSNGSLSSLCRSLASDVCLT